MAAAGPTNSAHEDSAHSVFMAIQWGKCANRQSPQHARDLSVGVPPLFSGDDVVRIAVVNKMHVVHTRMVDYPQPILSKVLLSFSQTTTHVARPSLA